MKKPKREKTVEFEATPHISKEQAIDIAYNIYESLDEACPTCSMYVVSTLISMLAINYLRGYESGKELFPHEDWIKAIAGGAIALVDRYEHTDSPTH